MSKANLDLIRRLCEKYPEWEKAFLFGDHEVYRVKKKVFVWMGEGETGGTYISVKLKDSQGAALMLPFVKPAAYGMAKWGWIAAEFPRGPVPESLVSQWIEESYRHTAPKKLLKQLAEGKPAGAPAPKTKTKTKKAPPRRASKRSA